MAIKIGRGTGYLHTGLSQGNNIDVTIADKDSNGFTPTAGTFLVLVSWGGNSSATDACAGGDVNCGFGMAVSATSRAGIGGGVYDAHANSQSTQYADAVLKTILMGQTTVEWAVDFVGTITDGVRFTVAVKDISASHNIRFQVLIIDGLSDVGIFQITAPGSPTNNVDHNGAGVAYADAFIFLTRGLTSATATAASLQLSIGAACADGQFVTSFKSRNAQVTQDTDHYGTDQECICDMNILGAINNRATFDPLDGSIADGVRLDWPASNGAIIVHCAALKGIDATIQNALTQTNTSAAIDIDGLSSTCLGGLVASCCEAEVTPGTSGAHHHWSLGTFVSPSNRGAHATWDENGIGGSAAQCATAVGYAGVYRNIAADDTLQGEMDVTAPNGSHSASFIMDTADPAQRWVAFMLFADPGAGVSDTPRTPAVTDAAIGNVQAIVGTGVVVPSMVKL